MLMVKPGLPYLDVVSSAKKTFPEYPLFVYQVLNNNYFYKISGFIQIKGIKLK